MYCRFLQGCDLTGDCLNKAIAWVFVGLPLVFTFVSLIVNNIVIVCHVRSALRVGGGSHTRAQLVQIRRVATQGFLYVGAFFICYLPAFLVRILGGQGYWLSKEADIYSILILQAGLLPLQGFFNMLIYVRPVFLRLKKAGASNWMALKGSILEPDIPKFISEKLQDSTSGIAPLSKASRSANNNSKAPVPGIDGNSTEDNMTGDDGDNERGMMGAEDDHFDDEISMTGGDLTDECFESTEANGVSETSVLSTHQP